MEEVFSFEGEAVVIGVNNASKGLCSGYQWARDATPASSVQA